MVEFHPVAGPRHSIFAKESRMRIFVFAAVLALTAGANMAFSQDACLDKCNIDLQACKKSQCEAKNVACFAKCTDVACKGRCMHETTTVCFQPCLAQNKTCQAACGQK